MDTIVAALEAQQAELDALVARLDAGGWATPTPACTGWTVADVLLHLAQTDELGTASAENRFAEFLAGVRAEGERDGAGAGGSRSGATTPVDEAAAVMVERERGAPDDEVLARWRGAAAAERAALSTRQPGDRVQWVTGDLAARTLATTRLAETWIHTTDIAGAVGAPLVPTTRLWHIARLAWRTLPYAFTQAGEALSAPVTLTLEGPGAEHWEFGGGDHGDEEPTDPAVTHVSGQAEEFCLVAARRRRPGETSLIATGPDAEAVLRLVRTYA
jgi:uncharacterized protein (TIGR03084 family)